MGSTFFKDKALREFPSYLRLMQLPQRDFPDIKVGRLFNLPASIYHQFWLSFTFGFANCNSFRSFGIFASLMTGNMVLLSIKAKEADDADAAFIAACVVSFFVFGTVASNLIIEGVKDRYHSFALIYLYVCVFMSIVEGIEIGLYNDHPSQHSPYVCFLIGGMGMLCHWCYKMNYQVVLHIGNVQKLLEYGYNKLFGYKVGGKRGIGDIVLASIILVGFVSGCMCALVTHIKHSLFPLLVLFPVHLYVSGTFDYWLELRQRRLDDAARNAGVSTDGFEATVSPIQAGTETNGMGNTVGAGAKGRTESIDSLVSVSASESSTNQFNPFSYKEDMGSVLDESYRRSLSTSSSQSNTLSATDNL